VDEFGFGMPHEPATEVVDPGRWAAREGMAPVGGPARV